MLQRLTDNAHEIAHRGRSYTIIERSRGRGYDMYINGRGPRRFQSVPGMMEAFPHLLQDLAMIAAGA